MNRLPCLCLFIVPLLPSLVRADAPTTPDLPVIPLPAHVIRTDGVFQLASDTHIVFEDATMPLARLLGGYLARATGYSLALVRKDEGRVIALRLDPSLAALGDDGYRMVIKPQRIDITGTKPAGVFYGLQTLRQLLPPQIFRRAPVREMPIGGGEGPRIEMRSARGEPASKPIKIEVVRPFEWTVPCAEIVDQPRFAWRGAHMDVSRHFQPREFIFKFLDLMALHKLNVFHFHLVDETGWRIEIRKYPKLTSVASREDYSSIYPDGATRSINQRPGGWYTQDDIREIVAYAAERFITVMPEIEMPGHSTAVILAYPEYGNVAQIRAAGGSEADLDTRWMNGVYNVDDATIAFLKDVLSEVLDLFPSRFIHVGGDEVDKAAWKRNPVAQARMKALGLKNEDELQSWFVRQFDDFLVSRGRRLIGWDEILDGGLAPNAAVMSWRGTAGGVAAAKKGHDVVMAPTSHTYFDYYQSALRTREPRAIGGFLPLEVAYSFEPIPAGLSADEAKHILGAQFQLWSEFIPHPRHMEYMAYPRACALAEVVWSPAESRSYASFVARLRQHVERLRVLDVNFRPFEPPDPTPVAAWKAGELTTTFAPREWDISSALPAAGRFAAIFSYTGGQHRLEIEWVELLCDGAVIARVDQKGWTGNAEKNNEYKFTLKPGQRGKFTLRASVRSDGGTDSNGNIYVLPESE